MSSQTSSRLVVGVDGSPQGDDALAFALAEAARCGDEVLLVTTWDRTPVALGLPMTPVTLPPSDEDLRDGARQAQAEALTRALSVAGDHGVTVGSEVFEGDPGARLVEASRGARLLVVGSRSLGAVRAVLLGSVSRYVARHAECPVVVVPGRHEREHHDTHERGELPGSETPRDWGSSTLTPMY